MLDCDGVNTGGSMIGSGSISDADFGTQVAALGAWRRAVAQALHRHGEWLERNDIADAGLRLRQERLLRRLQDDRMSIAFVAEFSRGKSELINAIFFSRYGRRVVPSSAGRTTMCPTELLHDPARPPSIRLLPIETRLREASLADLRDLPGDWRETLIDASDADSVAAAFDAVRQTRRVTVDEAVMLGLHDADDPRSPIVPDAQGMVDIPRWRHAIVNIPDPLLAQGLVIIDTPGLNAIGNEPELTLGLIPSSDAVVFMLAADAGVTRSDIDVWRDHIDPAQKSGRMVVLNKIDGLWDDLRRPAEIDLEVARQVNSVSQVLGIPLERVHPVSAQKGLVARIQRDDALLRRSRLAQFEAALSSELVHGRQMIVREQVTRGLEEIASVAGALSAVPPQGVGGAGGRAERPARQESRDGGPDGPAHPQRTRRVRDQPASASGAAGRVQAPCRRRAGGRGDRAPAQPRPRGPRSDAREQALGGSSFRHGQPQCRRSADFAEVRRLVGDISTLMGAMYKSFASDHGLALDAPAGFDANRFAEELDRVEVVYRRHSVRSRWSPPRSTR
jgi:hypothetical protein